MATAVWGRDPHLHVPYTHDRLLALHYTGRNAPHTTSCERQLRCNHGAAQHSQQHVLILESITGLLQHTLQAKHRGACWHLGVCRAMPMKRFLTEQDTQNNAINRKKQLQQSSSAAKVTTLR